MIGDSTNIDNENWENICNLKVEEGKKLNEIQIPFSKIEDEMIEKEIQNLEKQNTEVVNNPVELMAIKPTITLEEFQKIDLRVATVLSCEPIPKSKKLVKLEVSIGIEKRQVIAGIAQEVDPASIIGKQVVIIANLQPVTLMGLESQGMVLATSGSNDTFALLSLSKDVPAGLHIK